ncbi:rhomboid family intramembrane serine protease [Actinocorallia longicatena]|uniref:Rhomboid family intramembrane serine protease n=1 Tax=Actinocorallia longicatena TaxID=111803 RepID=A0ABP6QA41_9ACTN
MTEVPQAPDRTGVPTCYRHPGRETHVRCVRCDRYICPDCMVEASVGFQCPECVRDGNKGVRQAEGQFGGAPVARPYVTYVLIGINLLVFLGQLRNGTSTKQIAQFGLNGQAVADGEWYRIITSMFVHDGPPHILFNMWALYSLGQPLETALGRVRFGALYFLSGLGGSAMVYLLAADTFTVGASGAIYGLFGAFFVLARRLNLSMGPLVFLIILNLGITFLGANISWQGHIGGLVTGFLLGLAYVYAPRARRIAVQVGASVAVLVVVLAVIAVQTASLTS